ncbi:UNKNOWN [Stylonychia lemnae]|uniref:Calmodulin-lysine N-methyltransferase n=1 Tax=Stylonychia lemnae TaxID=5949 RepID=A0A078B725_STYLE|nr:UNKNOWN [Stylonychia lemnae]|eukprot:CDW90320.1 UNKNOWN [Stylonychia lemnae]
MEQQESKKIRIKNALGKFKQILLNKKVDISDLNKDHLDIDGLFEKTLENHILSYKISEDLPLLEFEQPIQEITLDELVNSMGNAVDNTGNVRVWPSEEILAYYIYINEDLRKSVLSQKRVLELGAGQSGLIGFMIGQLSIDNSDINIHITDGNSKCVQNIFELLWTIDESEIPLHDTYDYIFISDCLFFQDYHDALISTLKRLVNPIDGKIIIMAPKRGTTMQRFIDKAQNDFNIEIDHCPQLQELMLSKLQKQFEEKSKDHDDMTPHLITLNLKKTI